MPKKIFLSVIIPLYNEEKRASNISCLIRYLELKRFTWELILVDDGSLDRTKKMINKFLGKNVRSLSYQPNRGKGHAVKQGMLAATGKYRLFLDVDLSTPIDELDNFLPHLSRFDCLIGTRRAKGASVIVHQPWLRKTLGRCFTWLSRTILAVPVSDFTCGFKCFAAPAAKRIFGRSLINRWGFDSEILYLCLRFDFSLKEIPVVWKDDARTRVRFPVDLIRSLNELLAIRFNTWRGLYQ